MVYPYVIMTNERPECLFSLKDFVGLVGLKLGPDAKRFLEDILEEKDDRIEELEQDVEELRTEVRG